MPLRRFAVLAAATLLCLPVLRAQDANWSSQGLDALAAHASFHTDFTFDQSMLHAASQLMPDEDRPVMAKLQSVNVDSFRFATPGMYDPATLEWLRGAYNDHGWKHMVTKQAHPQPAAAGNVSAPDPVRTDVWVRMDNGNIDGAVVLVANERNVNLITVNGTISPVDLLHLRGHFGIPQFNGNDLSQAK